MGFFGLFGRQRDLSDATEKNDLINGFNTTQKTELPDTTIFKPTSFSEVQVIINTMKQQKNVIVHLNALKRETAVRVLDILSGAIYALGGGVYEMPDSKNAFFFSPKSLDVRL